MTDRELLELAAKAAGMDYLIWTPGASPILPGSYRTSERICWNPLTDDGDALRLASNLDLHIEMNFKGGWDFVVVGIYNDEYDSFVPGDDRTRSLAEETGNGEPLSAIRRAIVRAAAEIGRTL